MDHPQDNSWIEQSNDAVDPYAAHADAADANAALRETWAAFSGLLEEAQRSLDESPLNEAALVGAVRSRVARRERSRRRWTVGGVGLALAATLLVAVSLVRFAGDGGEVALAPQDNAVAAVDPAIVAQDKNIPPRRAVDPSLAWDDDEWNNSLAAVHQEAAQLETHWRQTTDALTNFQNRLDALQQEIEDSSL
jgi:hypothetical protein